MKDQKNIDDFEMCVKDEGYFRKVIKGLGLDPELEMTFMHYALYASRRAKKAKCKYAFFSFIAMLLPILSTALGLNGVDFNTLNWADINDVFKVVKIVLSAATAIATGCLSLFQYKDEWNRYRWYIENLIGILLAAIRMKKGEATPPEPPAGGGMEMPAVEQQSEVCVNGDINGYIAARLDALNGNHLKKWGERRTAKDDN